MSDGKNSFVCQWCKAELLVPKAMEGKRVRCGHCLTKVTVPAGLAAKLENYLPGSHNALTQGRSLFVEYLVLPERQIETGLRRCTKCHTDQFAGSEPCSCGGLTVGLDPLKVIHGREKIEQLAALNAVWLRSVLFKLDIGAAAIAALVFVYHLLFVNLIVSVVLIPLRLLPIVFLWGVGRFLFVQWYKTTIAENLPESWRGDAKRRGVLLRLVREYVEPFLERADFGHASQIPAEELRLLAKVFESRGYELEPELRHDFVHGCALICDFQEFKDRLERFAAMNDQSSLEIFATLYPTSENDSQYLPFLSQIEKLNARDFEASSVLESLHAARENQKVQAFEKDLARLKKNQQGFDIAIDQIDLMDPFNFELLVGMIFESLGFQVEETPKSGDQGADVILTKAGERTVVQTKLYSKPVGNSAVQEVVAARMHWKCHRTMVVTNNSFTPAAISLAQSNEVELVGRESLIDLLKAFNSQPKNYKKLMLLIQPKPSSTEAVIETVGGESLVELENQMDSRSE